MNGKIILGIVVAALVIIAGAGVVYYTESLGNAVHKGNLNITVADSGTGNVSWIFATFTKAMVNSNQSGWQSYSLQNESVNIFVNATYEQDISNIPLVSQGYSAIKLYMDSVVVGVNGLNTTFNLSSSYAYSSMTFHILPHQNTMLLFDFNASKDINWSTHSFTPNATVHTSS